MLHTKGGGDAEPKPTPAKGIHTSSGLLFSKQPLEFLPIVLRRAQPSARRAVAIFRLSGNAWLRGFFLAWWDHSAIYWENCEEPPLTGYSLVVKFRLKIFITPVSKHLVMTVGCCGRLLGYASPDSMKGSRIMQRNLSSANT